MLCPKCQKENIEGAKFCAFCGAPFKDFDTQHNSPKADRFLRPAITAVMFIIIVMLGITLRSFILWEEPEEFSLFFHYRLNPLIFIIAFSFFVFYIFKYFNTKDAEEKNKAERKAQVFFGILLGSGFFFFVMYGTG